MAEHCALADRRRRPAAASASWRGALAVAVVAGAMGWGLRRRQVGRGPSKTKPMACFEGGVVAQLEVLVAGDVVGLADGGEGLGLLDRVDARGRPRGRGPGRACRWGYPVLSAKRSPSTRSAETGSAATAAVFGSAGFGGRSPQEARRAQPSASRGCAPRVLKRQREPSHDSRGFALCAARGRRRRRRHPPFQRASNRVVGHPQQSGSSTSSSRLRSSR